MLPTMTIRHEQENRTSALAGDTQVAHSGPDTVREVQEQHHHGNDVEDGHGPATETCHQVGVDSTVFERVGRRRSDTHGEIQDVEDDERQQSSGHP